MAICLPKPWLFWESNILVCDCINMSDNQLQKENFILSRIPLFI